MKLLRPLPWRLLRRERHSCRRRRLRTRTALQARTPSRSSYAILQDKRREAPQRCASERVLHTARSNTIPSADKRPHAQLVTILSRHVWLPAALNTRHTRTNASWELMAQRSFGRAAAKINRLPALPTPCNAPMARGLAARGPTVGLFVRISYLIICSPAQIFKQPIYSTSPNTP